ncbi:MAG: metalloregulator ArsR/SmtB family transcription factor [Candidatus Lutibacillus vidarii]|jgi:ArsR family transcriptional regulator|nr:helix-turn-helix transcriptional regulator [Candidatus Lutibacillus vidarii]HRB99783.1 metalloregulator ArsR/SmtB family transcription factor [Dermatophilaceae bacterium]
MSTTRIQVTPVEADLCCAGADCELLPATEADVLADVFKALADPTRVRLLRYLAESEAGTACACHLPDALGITQPTLSFHMRKLHDAGLVARDKRGRWVHWTVRPESLAAVRAFLDLPATSGTCC